MSASPATPPPEPVTGSFTSQKTTRDWAFASRDKGRDPLGTALFVLLRSADVYLQYTLLTSTVVPSLLHSLNLRTISPLPSSTGGSSTAAGPFALGLLRHRLTPYHATVLLLSLGSAAKQIFWQTHLSRELMRPSFALLVAGFNTLSNTLNTLLSLCSATSQAPSVHGASPFAASSSPSSLLLTTASPSSFLSPLIPGGGQHHHHHHLFPAAYGVGLTLYAAGLALELGSELQRARFKADPRNEGRMHADGLFGWATNVNYGGYLLWRAGYALACGGWAWAAAVAAGQGYDFASRAVPSMDAYCEARYGREEAERVRRKVRRRLLPFIY